MFVFGFFPIPLSQATKKLDFFFVIVCRSESLRQRIVFFVALSHCEKQIFCLLHWVTVTNKVCICSGKKLKKGPKMLHFLVLFAIFETFCYFLAFCMPIFVLFSKKFYTLWHFVCKIYQFWLSQWLSATNKKSICRSDSVRQTKQIFVTVTQCDKQYWKKYPSYLSHVTKELKKKPKTNIISNLNFITAIKLLWGTFPVAVWGSVHRAVVAPAAAGNGR